MAKNKSKKKEKRERRQQSQAGEAAESMRQQGRGDIVSDILGSYTGTAYDGGVPEQDADDL